MGKKKTTNEFIKEATSKHNGKYDYSLVEYKGNKTNVSIICPIHGEFQQTPDRHLHSGGCLKCAAEKRGLKRRMTFDEFLEKAKKIHGEKYSYVKETFSKGGAETTIICPKHGEFQQTPDSHLQGHGCPKCKSEKLAKLRKEEFGDFIEKAKKVHGDKYDYSKVEYIRSNKNVYITCPIHGVFPQTPNSHLMGAGCPFCKNSHLEEKIAKILDKLGVNYVREQRYEWLFNDKKMSLDFYLPKYNIAIECQGDQHVFYRDTYYNVEGKFEKRVALDKLKNKLCKEHNIPIIYIFNKLHSSSRLNELFEHMYDDAIFIEDINNDNNTLLKAINEKSNKIN